MRALLVHEDLWKSIAGYPTGDTTSEEVKFSRDQKALAKICLTLDGSAITHVRTAKTAKEAWDALAKVFEDTGMGRRLFLERKLYRYSLSDFKNIEEYLNAVMSTAQDLADIGKVIDDSSIAAIILGGLTQKYEPLIMALENSNVEITTELVKTKLLNEIAKIAAEDEVTAFRSSGSSRSTTRLNKKKPVVCYGCKESGHKRPDCPLKKKRNKEKSLLALGIGEGDSINHWYVDSGASQHMTPRRDWFVNLKPKDSVSVTVANGERINCEGFGDISIPLSLM